MITDGQMIVVEDQCRRVLRALANARLADNEVRVVAENPKLYSGAHARDVEKRGRFEDRVLTESIDNLRHELSKLPRSEGLAVANRKRPELVS